VNDELHIGTLGNLFAHREHGRYGSRQGTSPFEALKMKMTKKMRKVKECKKTLVAFFSGLGSLLLKDSKKNKCNNSKCAKKSSKGNEQVGKSQFVSLFKKILVMPAII
jgi:hypothetical protein